MAERLRNKILPDAVRAKSFGPDILKFVAFEPDKRKIIDQYVSDIICGDVTLETTDGRTVKESVVIKMQPKRGAFAPIHDISHHLRNELLFYTEILPLFRKYDTEDFFSKNVPEFVYGTASVKNPKEDVIILKNMNKKGFQMTKERLFLDKKHIKLALTGLATFHAISSKCQQKDPAGFNNVVSKISPGIPRKRNLTPDGKSPWASVYHRGVDPLKTDQKYKNRLEDIYKHFETDVSQLKKHPNSSEAGVVLMHGDFIRNNLMYKYNSNGQPEEVIILDWCSYSYPSSPAIDLSALLMSHTSPEMKRLHWDDFLRTYHGVLSKKLSGHSARTSFEEFELEVRKKGVYGYHWSTILIPAALGTGDKQEINLENCVQQLMDSGGEEGTHYLVEIVKFMLDRNFIFEY